MDTCAPGYRFQVLGPVRAWRVDGRAENALDLGPAKQRAVLALLALSAGSSVPRDSIIEFLWPDEPPPSAVNAVQTYIKGLRRALEPGRRARTRSQVLPAGGGGYRLGVSAEQVDLLRFRSLTDTAREAQQSGQFEKAVELRRSAFELVKNRPLSDLGTMVRLHPKVTAIEQELLGATIEFVDGELTVGRAANLLPWLKELAGANPLHEPLQGRLMRVLADCGQQAEALSVFASTQERLRDELGVDAGPELRRIHEDLLRADRVGAAPPVEWEGRRPALDQLIGRGDELTRLSATAVRRRVVTLVGPGGAGKTALGLATANQVTTSFPDGVTVVELGALPAESGKDPEGHVSLVAAALRNTLGAQGQGRAPALVTAVQALQRRRGLVLLDNAEHVIRGCARVVEHITRACPSVSFLVTSRRPLGIPGETVWDVAPLAVPDAELPPERIAECASVELFLRRVRESCPGLSLDDQLSLVGRLCRRLDGLPLAIELAAARLRTMSLADLNARLSRQPSVLAHSSATGLPHQRQLESTIEWSLRLLPASRRLLLSRLSVFAGTFTLDAAEHVCGFAPLAESEIPSLLADLVDNSLVQPVREREYRYRLLIPVREYVTAAADADDLWSVRLRHLKWCLSLVEATTRAGMRPADVMAKVDDIFAALSWAFAGTADAARWELGVRLLTEGRGVWDAYATNLDTVRYWTRRALVREARLPRELRTGLLHWAGRLSYLTGLPSEARTYLSKALERYSTLSAQERSLRVDAMIGVAAARECLADPEVAEYAHEVIEIARSIGDRTMLAKALLDMGTLLAERGHRRAGMAAIAEARVLARGNVALTRSCDYREAIVAVWDRRPLDSLAASGRALECADDASPLVLIDVHLYRGWAHILLGDTDNARTELAESLAHLRRSGRLVSATYPLLAFAYVDYVAGRIDSARIHLRHCLENALDNSDRLAAVHAVTLAGALASRLGHPTGPELVALGDACRKRTGTPLWPFTEEERARWPATEPAERPEAGGETGELIISAVESALAFVHSPATVPG